MDRLQVLVISAGPETGFWLAGRLSSVCFEVRTTRPGPALVEAVRAAKPSLVVVDGIDARPGMASLEVALLKDCNPDVRIIALSDFSSEVDAEVVEQGIFCYLAGCSREELLRVIEAAARKRAVGRDGQGSS